MRFSLSPIITTFQQQIKCLLMSRPCVPMSFPAPGCRPLVWIKEPSLKHLAFVFLDFNSWDELTSKCWQLKSCIVCFDHLNIYLFAYNKKYELYSANKKSFELLLPTSWWMMSPHNTGLRSTDCQADKTDAAALIHCDILCYISDPGRYYEKENRNKQEK